MAAEPLLLASFNVNSIKVRLPILLEWLQRRRLEVVCLQEIKCIAENFPTAALRNAGYHCLVVGQKAYNGVAIIARQPLTLLEEGLVARDTSAAGETLSSQVTFDRSADSQARWLLAQHPQLGLIASVYCPNGNPYPGEKFDYKLAWMEDLHARIIQLVQQKARFTLLGDFNMLPADRDCYAPEQFINDALAQPAVRGFYHRWTNLGLTDAWTACHGNQQGYTYWDYMRNRFDKDHGLRIDHAYLSPRAADTLVDCQIDRWPRQQSSPSDHTPLVISVNL